MENLTCTCPKQIRSVAQLCPLHQHEREFWADNLRPVVASVETEVLTHAPEILEVIERVAA